MKIQKRVNPAQLHSSEYYLALHTHHAATAVGFRNRARIELINHDVNAYRGYMRGARAQAASARRALRNYRRHLESPAY